MAEKNILIDLGTVRICEYNEMNVMVERQEEVFNPTSQQKEMKWKFKGYHSTILKALKAIVRDELLVNKNVQIGLESYIEQIIQANAKVLEVMKT